MRIETAGSGAQIGAAGASGEGGALQVGEMTIDDLAEVLVEAGHAERETLRRAAEAQAEAARAQRREAIAQMREAADDTFSSAICQAVVGVAAAAIQGAGAVGGALAAAGDAKKAAPAADWIYEALGPAGGALSAAAPLIDQWSRNASEHDIRAAEHRDLAESLGEYAQRIRAGIDASRSAERDAVAQAGRAMEARDRAVTIAIGRE